MKIYVTSFMNAPDDLLIFVTDRLYHHRILIRVSFCWYKMITLAPYFEQYEFNYKQIILLPSRKNIYKIQWGSVDQKHSKQDIWFGFQMLKLVPTIWKATIQNVHHLDCFQMIGLSLCSNSIWNPDHLTIKQFFDHLNTGIRFWDANCSILCFRVWHN